MVRLIFARHLIIGILIILCSFSTLAFSAYPLTNPKLYFDVVWGHVDDATVRSSTLVNLQFFASAANASEAGNLTGYVYFGTNESNLSLIASNLTARYGVYNWTNIGTNHADFEYNVTNLTQNTKYFWYAVISNGTYNESTNGFGNHTFYTPGPVQDNAYAYWDFRGMDLTEFYTLTVGVNSTPMVNWSTVFGNGTAGSGSALSIASGVPNPDENPDDWTWSYAGWIYVNTSLGTHDLIVMDDGTGGSSRHVKIYWHTTFGLSMSCRDGGGIYVNNGIATIPSNQWIFLGISNNGTGTFSGSSTVYVNGTSVGTPIARRCSFNITANDVKFYPQAIGPTALWTYAVPSSVITGFYNNNSYFQWMTSNTAPRWTAFGASPANNSVNQSANVTLSWNAASDVEGNSFAYYVYVGTSEGSLQLVSSGQSGLNYTLYNLSGLTTYYWKVVARDQFNAENDGGVYRFTTANRAPIVTLIAPSNGNTSVPKNQTLYWSGYDNESSVLTYDVYFSTNGSNVTLVSTNQSAANYSPNMSAHTQYFWKVVAWDNQSVASNSTVWNFTTENLAPVITAFYPPDTLVNKTSKFVELTWNATDGDNDTVYFNVTAGGLTQSYVAYASTRNIARVNEFNDDMIINWDIVAYDLYGGVTTIGAPTVSFFTENDPAVGSVTLAELKGQSSASLAVNESLNLWCTFNDTSMVYWRLYKEGVLNRSGYAQNEEEVFYSPHTVASSDGYAARAYNADFQAYVDGTGAGKVYAGSTLTFDSSTDVDIFEAKAYVGKYADAVVVFYRRLSDGYLREAVCTTTECTSRVLIAQNVTAFSSYQIPNDPGDLDYVYTVGVDDVYSDVSLVDSSGSQYVGLGFSGMYYYDVTTQQVGSVSTPGIESLVVAERYDGSGNDVIAFTNASGGYMFSSNDSTVYKFANNVSALSMYGASTGSMVLMYSNGVNTVYRVCWSTAACGSEHVVASGVSSQTQLQEGRGAVSQWLYSYTNASSMSMRVGESSYYSPSIEYLVANVSSSELVVGQNWTGNCTPLNAGRYNAFPAGYGNKDSGVAVSSATKMVQSTTNVPPVFVSFDPVNGSSGLMFNYTLSWVATDANLDPLTYDVYVGTNQSLLQLVANDISASNYSPTLTGHTEYFWRVTVNDSIDVVDSGVRNFSTANREPAMSLFSPASGSTVSTGTMSWAYSDDDNDTVYFNVYHGNTSNPPLVSFGQISTSYTPSVLANVTYFWRIVANDTRNTTNSSIFNYTTSVIPPNVPTNESPANGTSGLTGTVTLQWNSSDNQSNPLTYDVYVGTSPLLMSLVGDNQVANSKSVSTNYSTTYYWQIVVNNSAATTTGPVWQFSTVVNIAPTTPGAVIWMDTSQTPVPEYAINGRTNIPLTPSVYWARSSDANGDTINYDIYLGFSAGNMPKLTSQNPNSRVLSLEAAKTYYIKIVANDSQLTNEGPTSSFSTRLNSTPTIALNSPSDGATGQLQATTLSWTGTAPDGDVLSYDVYIGNASNNTQYVTTTSSSSYVNYGALLTTYYWNIVAKNSIGAQAVSATRSYTTVAAAAAPPTTPTVTYPQSGTVTNNNPTVEWTPSQSQNPVQYNVTVTINNGTSNTTLNITTNTTKLNLSEFLNITENTTINVEVIATDGITSSPSSETEFSTLEPTSPSEPTLSQPTQDPNSDVIFQPPVDPNTGTTPDGTMIVTNPSTGETTTLPMPNVPTTLDPGEYGCDPGQTCQFQFIVLPQNGDGGLNITINITNPPGLQDGHNSLVSLKVTPSALVPQANISLGSIYKCASNPAQGICEGQSGVVVGNMYSEEVNGLNRTIQEFACYDPVNGTKISSMTVAKTYCPYEIYASDLNRDGTSEVIAFDGVYDMQRSIALKLFTGTKPYDFIVPLDVNGDGSMDFVYSKRASDGFGVFASSRPLQDGEIQVVHQQDRLLFGLDDCESRTRELQYTAQVILENGELGESIVVDNIPPTNDPCNLQSSDAYDPGDYVVNWQAIDPVTGSTVSSGSTSFTTEREPAADVSKCLLGVDGEFNYFDSPRMHDWIISSYGSEPVVDPAVDGAAVYVSDGVVMTHYVECMKSRFEVETLLAPLDVANYMMKLSILGQRDGKEVTVNSLWVEDLGKTGVSENMFVVDRTCESCEADNYKKAIGYAAVGSKTGNAVLDINGDIYSAGVGQTLEIGDAEIKIESIESVTTDQGEEVRVRFTAKNNIDSVTKSMYENYITDVQLSGSPILYVTTVTLVPASEITFEKVRLVANMNLNTVEVYVGESTSPVATVPFIQEIDQITGVRMESVEKKTNELMNGFAVDYLRTIGTGQSHKALTPKQQRTLNAMSGMDSLDGCVVEAGTNYSHIGTYCENLGDENVISGKVCGLDELRIAVQYNKDCFKESLNYCGKYTYPKTQGFSESRIISGDVPQQNMIEGLSACTVALSGSQAAGWVFMPIFYGLKTVILNNIILVIAIALIVMVAMAAGRKR